jgi:hypothetical protein
MTSWSLFLKKTAAVFVLAFALVPLLEAKGRLPASAYVGGLVALHIFVLAVYLYRVRFRDLDMDLRSLAARVVALLVVTYLLAVVSGFEAGMPRGQLVVQMLAVCVLHTAILVLLMTRVERPARALLGRGDGESPRSAA